jgi:cation:H+ antiporter
MMAIIYLVLGLSLLTFGADILVKGASRLALSWGISAVVVGLTVVALGTSAPELMVSASAAWHGQSDIVLGNVVGSNIVNVLLILGSCACISALRIHKQILDFDMPIMIIASLIMILFASDGQVKRIEGLMLVSGLVAYVRHLIKKGKDQDACAKRESIGYESPGPSPGYSSLVNMGLVIIGLVLLVAGAELFINGAVSVARYFGVSELAIGLTIVAVGTSLPEVATSIVATIKGERDIAVGNIVGSNIFNIFAVLGVSSVIRPIVGAPAAMHFDIPFMVAVALICFPFFRSGQELSRREGVFLLSAYVAYTIYVLCRS